MPVIVSPKLLHGYLFASSGESDAEVWARLKERFPQDSEDRWRHVYTLGRFDFAVFRLADKLYGSDLRLFEGGFLPGIHDVVELAWFQWEDTGASASALGSGQEQRWEDAWGSDLPVFALISITPCAGWDWGDTPQQEVRTAALIRGALRDSIAASDAAFIPLAGIGPEPFGLCLFCRSFQVLFDVIRAIETIPQPVAGSRRPAFEHVRTVCGLSAGSSAGGEPRSLRDELSRLYGLGDLHPTISVNTMAGVAPSHALKQLGALAGRCGPEAGRRESAVFTAVGTVDYQVRFNRAVDALALMRELLDISESGPPRLAKLETIVAVPWDEGQEGDLTAWPDGEDSPCANAAGREARILGAARVLRDHFVREPELPAVVEAVTFILERGYTFLRNRSTSRLVADLWPFLLDLCSRVETIEVRRKKLSRLSCHVDDAEARVEEHRLDSMQRSRLEAELASAREVERHTRDSFASRCHSVRRMAIEFARALRQGASGNFPHLFDANLQARADTHFASFRRFLQAAGALLRSLYRATGDHGVEPFTGFVTCGSEHGFQSVPGDIVHVPFHLVRRPEALHVIAHEFGHQLDRKLGVQRDVLGIAETLAPALGSLAPLLSSKPVAPHSAAQTRRHRLREAFPDMVWAVAVSEQAETPSLTGFPAVVGHLVSHYDQILASSQLSDLIQRMLCVCMAGCFFDALGSEMGVAEVRAMLASDLPARAFGHCKRGFLAELDMPSTTLRRVAQACFLWLSQAKAFDHIAQEAVVLAGLLSTKRRIGEVLHAIAQFGVGTAALEGLAQDALAGKVGAFDSQRVLGPRLCWQFDRMHRSGASASSELDVPPMNSRLALVAILEQLR